MTDNPRRDLLKKAAALGIGAIASASSAFPRAGGAFEQADLKPGDTEFFPGFKKLTKKTSGATINFVTAGNGPGCCYSTAIRKRTSNGAGLRPSSPKPIRWLRPISAGMETAASPRMGKTTLAIRNERRRKTRWK